MKRTRKFITLVTVIVLITICFAFGASALETTGQCGDNIYWSYNESAGLLKLEGHGAMYNYNTSSNPAPWKDSYSTEINSIEISEGVTEIGDNAFSWLPNLKNIKIADTVSSIGTYSLAGTAVETIDLPHALTTIKPSAFQACVKLTEIELPDNLLKLGNYAFAGSGITEIYIPDSVSLESTYEMPTSKIFYGCKNLKTVVLGKNVTNCPTGIFGDCESLEIIVILGKLTKISTSAFYNCTSLSDVYYVGTEEEWNTIDIEIDNADIVNANKHFTHSCLDLESDGLCDSCGIKVGATINPPSEPDVPDEPTDEPEEKPCDCNCHAGGIKAFFFKLINFFAKIFSKDARTCQCGKSH